MASVEVEIRQERPGDETAIDDVVTLAFAPDTTVAPLVRDIRASPRYVPDLALVAERDGVIVGHVMLSHADVVDEATVVREVLTLSPLSVVPHLQRTGIGTRLAVEALRLADEAGEPLVTVEGHPTYYPRFGFGPAAALGIEITLPDWAPPEAAMAIALSRYAAEFRGRLVYPPAFDEVAHEPPPSA